MHYEDISLVIIGYDPYVDVWNHYFDLLNKYWADRPDTYLITNEITPEYKNVKVYAAGADAEWSKKVQVALEKVQTKYILLLLEDFFATRPVSNEDFSGLMDIVRADGVTYCKLLNQSKIKGKRYKDKKYLHIIPEKEDYGVSLQPAIWDRDYLKKIVGDENYNAWIFEFNQVKNKPQNLEGAHCLADDRNLLQITHAVVQSKYLPSAIKVFKKQNYEIDLSAREPLSKKLYFKYRLKLKVKDLSPKFMIPFFKKIGRLMKVDFVSDRQLGGKQ